MAEDVTTLGLAVDTSGVKSAGADLDSLAKRAGAAADQASHLDEVLARAGKGGKGIDDYINKLKVQSAQLGYTATQQKLIELASKGATEAQIREARSVLETIDAYDKKQKSAAAAAKAASSIDEAKIARAAALGTGIGTAIGQGAGFAVRKVFDLAHSFEELTKSASEYKDLEEAFGAPAEGLAAVDVAAKVAGSSIQEVANFTGRLTRGLAGVDDETKNAGAALERLGIDVKQFKTTDPVTQLEILGKALAKFKDGQSKTELIGDLGGRGAARILPFLKELNEEGGRNVILTQEQIDKADAYKDAQARTRATLDQYLKLISLQALPALTSLTGALIDVAKEMLGVDKQTGVLKNNTAVRDFAEQAVISFAQVVDVINTTVGALALVGRSFAQVFEDVKLLASAASLAGKASSLTSNPGRIGEVIDDTKEFKAQLAERNKNLEDYNGKLDNFLNSSTTKFEDAVRVRIKKARENDAALKGVKDDRPALALRGGKDKKTKGAATDKDLLGFELSDLKDALQGVKAAYQDQESQLEAIKAAGLLDDNQYYDLKLRLLRESTGKEIDELQAENAARQKFLDLNLGTEKDRLSLQRDINKTDAQISRQRDSEASKEFVIEVQRSTALNSVKKAYEEARIAAQQYLDTIELQHKRELDAFGKGDVEKRRTDGANQILDRYQGQRDDLNKNKDLAVLEGKFTEEQRTQYEARLKLIDEFQGKALTEWDDYYGKLLTKEQDGTNGFSAALANLSDQAGFTAKNVESVTTNAFKGMEDAIVSFATTGKLSFKSMIDSFVADIIRLTIQQQLIKPIANYLNGTDGGPTSGGSSTGGFLAGLVGLAGSFFGGGSGGSFGSGYGGEGNGLNSSSGAEIRGRRALGGPVSAGGKYQVAEHGQPELLSVAGRSYLMMGGQSGSVTPAQQSSGGGRPIVFNNHQTFAPGTDRKTTDQAAAQAASTLKRAQRIQ